MSARRIFVYRCVVFSYVGTERERAARVIWNADMSDKVPACVAPASEVDFKATKDWQTRRTSAYDTTPPKATHMEYDFVTRVAESESYLQRAGAMWVRALTHYQTQNGK